MDITKYVANDIEEQKGVSFPVKAGLLERLFVKKALCSRIHANPEDEFSIKSIGPNLEIIADYEKKIRDRMAIDQPPFEDALIVEKLRSREYLLLNGHHRWAAAMRMGLKRVPIKIINCASESDIRKILENSKHDKRATLDLDEVIIRPSDYEYLEKKAFSFPMSLRVKKRVRLGIPVLLYTLVRHGYDIWVYAADYYSIDDVAKFFKMYSMHVDGIITGISKKKQNKSEKAERMETLISNKYKTTLHIDDGMILETHGKEGDYSEYEINAPEQDWAKAAIAIIEEIEKNAGK